MTQEKWIQITDERVDCDGCVLRVVNGLSFAVIPIDPCQGRCDVPSTTLNHRLLTPEEIMEVKLSL